MPLPPRDAGNLPRSFPSTRYDVRRLIGEGSRKQVFLAQDLRLNRPVAIGFIKTEGLDQVALERVEHEAREMGRLGDHPNIVTVYDIDEADGQIYIVSQFMAGGDVKQLMERSAGHRVPIARAMEIGEQICCALEHAHALGVVHRDVKPDNVWLTDSGVAKLGDFGLAVTRDRARVTSEGVIVGTFAYMAPEQALGRPPEPRSDLYALGAVLYEMITGRPPFVGDDPIAVVSQHINAVPVAPSWHDPEMPSDLEALILKLLSKLPDDRPIDAAAVRAALVAISRSPLSRTEAIGRENPIARLAGGLFVGRESEMGDLRRDVAETLAGHGRLVLIGGEPGIGKTSTAQEIATYARLVGLQALWGRCDDTGGAPPYWPWVQMIRSYVHDSTHADVAAVMGSGAADIAQVVPEVGRELPIAPNAPAVESDQARFRLFDSITTFLRNASRQQPMMLVFDDLHAADKPSLLLLQFLARQMSDMRIMIVAGYRDVEVARQHPLFQVLGELVREQVTRRLTLRGLGERDVGRYIELSAGMVPDTPLVAAVSRETEGNPFFVGEVVRLLVSEGRLEAAETTSVWRSTIPQGVREVIGRRLDRLSEECNRTLSRAAVIGKEFALNVLERVCELPRDRVLEVLEEAIQARVVVEMPGPARRYCFSHGLFRETLYAEFTTTRRVQVHRRVGEALESIYRLEVESHLPELAYHFFEAIQGGEVEKALSYSVRAGERASQQMAHEDAIRHYERVLQALELSDRPEGSRLIDILLAQTEALWRAGEVERAKEVSLRAVNVARAEGATEQLVRGVLGFAGRLAAFGAVSRDDRVVALLEEALRLLPDGDSSLRARAMARLAEELTLAEAHEHRWELSRSAVAMARRLGDPRVLLETLKSQFLAVWEPGGADDRIAVSGEIIRLAEATQDRALVLEGHIYRVLGMVESGDAVSARRDFDTCERISKELRQPYHQFLVGVLRGLMAFADGRLGDVERLAQDAMALGERAQTTNGTLLCGVQLGRLTWLQGRFEENEAMLRGFGFMYPVLQASVSASLAACLGEQGREEETRGEIERVASADFVDLPRHLSWQATMACLAESCAAVRDAPRARQLYALLLPLDGRNLVLAPSVTWGPAAYYLGILAATCDRWQEADGHFEAALAMEGRLGERQHLARTQVAYAEMLLRRGDPGEESRALQLVQDAMAIAHELGMARLAERANALEARLEKHGVSPHAVGAQTNVPEDSKSGGPEEQVVLFRREGEFWTVAQDECVLRLKDTKGLRYLAHLLRHPTLDFQVLEVLSVIAGASSIPLHHDETEVAPEDARALDLPGTGVVIDEVAKSQYRTRLTALREDLEEAERFNDQGRAERLRSEMDALTQQLAAAIGLGGRDRVSGSSAERARWTVTKGIKNAVQKIGRGNPRLGRYLGARVRTGYVCSYSPDPDRPVRWVF